VQAGTVGNRARHLLDENLFASRAGERVLLQGEILVEGRNAGVADQEALLVYLSIPSLPRMSLRHLRFDGVAFDLPRGCGSAFRFFLRQGILS